MGVVPVIGARGGDGAGMKTLVLHDLSEWQNDSIGKLVDFKAALHLTESQYLAQDHIIISCIIPIFSQICMLEFHKMVAIA